MSVLHSDYRWKGLDLRSCFGSFVIDKREIPHSLQLVLTIFLRNLDKIDLFSLGSLFPITDHVAFSRDLFFYPSKNDSLIQTRLFENFKARILESIIIWYEMG